MDEFVGEGDPVILRYDMHQVLLDLFGCGVAGEIKAAGEAQDMGIDDDSYCFLVRHSEDYVGGLAGNSGEGEELVHRTGNLALEFADE